MCHKLHPIRSRVFHDRGDEELKVIGRFFNAAHVVVGRGKVDHPNLNGLET